MEEIVRDDRLASVRGIYLKHLRSLPIAKKLELVHGGLPNALYALCLDPNPQIAIAIINCGQFNRRHALILATNHHSVQGLDYLTTRPGMVADRAVLDSLFRNSTLGIGAIKRCLLYLTLFEIYRIVVGREVTEAVKTESRTNFRSRFESATPGEKAKVVLTTEGRCLLLLYGIRFDPDTVKIIASQENYSIVLARNLLIFPGVQSEIIRAISKCNVVWKNSEMRKIILAHSNCPYDVKFRRK